MSVVDIILIVVIVAITVGLFIVGYRDGRGGV